MIRTWRVANFKSFRTPPALDLAYVNVIAGANSSGKSSIIQSILLLKQTLQYGSTNRSVSLNGPILRLGAFEDVRNFNAGNAAIEISFEIEISPTEASQIRSSPWVKNIRRHTLGADQFIPKSIGLSLSFKKETEEQVENLTPIPSKSSLTPQLIAGMLTVTRRGDKDSEFSNYYRYTLGAPYNLEGNPPFAPYQVELDDESRVDVIGRKPDAYLQGGYVSHFLPSWTVVRYNETADHALRLTETLFSDAFSIASASSLEDSLPDTVVSLINEWLDRQGATRLISSDEGVRAKVAKAALQPFVIQSRFTNRSGLLRQAMVDPQLDSELSSLKDGVFAALIAEEPYPTWDYDLETPKAIVGATEFLKEFIKSGVRYLGPLRDSPRPVYQPEALESTTDVGYRGEHTAAVLDLNSSALVWYYQPPGEGSNFDYLARTTRKRAKLSKAVQVWLQYLGVANDVETSDAGVYGNRMQVRISEEDRLHDLTNVGVGVSQVLPIVVMSLLAQSGSLLIFEQPELHLHPKVQARLADFFLALAKDGKQTLLETHSEYLVDRLRLRIALAEDEDAGEMVNIMFSQRQGEDSEVVALKVNKFGAITNWPKDFFEQSQQDVTRILKAAAARRKKLAESN